MYAKELKKIRESIKLDMRSMAICLDQMPYRTYQDYEYGNRPIPQHVADKVLKLKRKNKNFLQQIEKTIASEYPNGIISP